MKTTELPSPAASPRGPGAAVRAFPAEAVRRIVDRFTYPAERPVVTLLLYYSLLFLIGAALVWFVPGAGAMISGERLAQLGAAKGLQDLVPGPAFAWNISFSMALSMVGAFVLMLPSSWVYMATRQRKGFDQQVVQTFIVLAVAVAGVIIIARNSVALAFSLAGVVGAVRFRNTLPETRDTLYIFLAIGVGLASGVEALTAAAVLSMVFNFIVLIMDRGNYGSCALGTDPRRLLVGAATATPEKKAKDFTAVLVVRVSDADAARASVEAILDGEVSRWRLAEVETTRKGKGVLKYLIRLGKRVEAANLEDALIAAGGPSVIGARIH